MRPIGVVPLAACRPQVSNLKLKVVRLNKFWARRRLLLASRANQELTPAAGLLLSHLQGMATENGAAA